VNIWTPDQRKIKKVLFDSSALFNTTEDEINYIQSTYVEPSKVQIFDSLTNMYEIIHHFRNNRGAMLRRMNNLAELSKENMLPSIKTIIINEIRYFLYHKRDTNEVKHEMAHLLFQRRQIIELHPQAERDFIAPIIDNVERMRSGYVRDILDLKQTVSADDMDNSLDSDDFRSQLFHALMERFSVPDTLKASIAMNSEWLKVPPLRIFYVYYVSKLRQYRSQWMNPAWQGPPPSDFMDLDFSTYIPIMNIFVTNNTHDFQNVFRDMAEIIEKIKTKNQFVERDW